jgi:glycosyltransferase involved in cell wall biosynthesis
MRVLILAHRYLPHGRGGVETWTRILATGLTRAGHTVAVLARDDRERRGRTPGEAAVQPPFSRREEREAFEGGEFAVHWLVHRHQDANGYETTWDDERFDAPIATLIAAFRPDVLHLAHPDGWGRRPLEVARSVGVPVVLTLHDYAWICGRGQMIRPPGIPCRRVEESRCARCLSSQISRGLARGTALRTLGRLAAGLRDEAGDRDATMGVDQRRFPPARAAERWRVRQAAMRDVLNRADAVTSPSQFVADRHRATGVDRRIDVIRQGMDGPVSISYERAPGPLRVGWFGNPLPTKGLAFLVTAARSVPTGAIEVHVHGSAEASEEAHVRIHGTYPPEEAVARMQTVDVVAIPSSWDENAPMVALEARWAGRPLLVSDRGGLPELVADDGWVESLEIEAWSERLALLASRPAAAGEAAARAPEPRDASRMCADYSAVYERVLAPPT